jgi:uncharacterized protein
MTGGDYTWDRRKAAANLRKHGLRLPDEAHSDEEERTILIGRIIGGVVVSVVFAQEAGSIRIISARPASARERREYYGDEEG